MADGSSQGANAGNGLTISGWLLIVVGLITSGIGFAYNVTIETPGGQYDLPTRVVNLQQLQIQELLVLGGLLVFLGGIVACTGGAIVDEIRFGKNFTDNVTGTRAVGAAVASELPAPAEGESAAPAGQPEEENKTILWVLVGMGVVTLLAMILVALFVSHPSSTNAIAVNATTNAAELDEAERAADNAMNAANDATREANRLLR